MFLSFSVFNVVDARKKVSHQTSNNIEHRLQLIYVISVNVFFLFVMMSAFVSAALWLNDDDFLHLNL